MRAHVLHAESIRSNESCYPAPRVTMIAVVRRALVDHEAVPGAPLPRGVAVDRVVVGGVAAAAAARVVLVAEVVAADARRRLLAHCPGARKVLGWPKRCNLARAFLWEYS